MRGKYVVTTLISFFAWSQLPAKAGEGLFGWIYTTDLTPAGKFEFEHKAFLQQGQSRGNYSFLQNSDEIEYGVTDKFQVAGYLNWSYRNAARNGIDGTTGGKGVSQYMTADSNPYGRLAQARFDTVSAEFIYQFMNPYTDPLGFAVYVEPEFGSVDLELETRILLQKNFLDDKLVVAANLLLRQERERYADGSVNRDSPLDILLGVNYRVMDNWFLGLEGRIHNEFSGGYLFNVADHQAFFLGPVVHYAQENFWATVAWRHQLPIVRTFNEDQAAVVYGGRIYGDEHSRDEVMVKIGIPFN